MERAAGTNLAALPSFAMPLDADENEDEYEEDKSTSSESSSDNDKEEKIEYISSFGPDLAATKINEQNKADQVQIGPQPPPPNFQSHLRRKLLPLEISLIFRIALK